MTCFIMSKGVEEEQMSRMVGLGWKGSWTKYRTLQCNITWSHAGKLSWCLVQQASYKQRERMRGLSAMFPSGRDWREHLLISCLKAVQMAAIVSTMTRSLRQPSALANTIPPQRRQSPSSKTSQQHHSSSSTRNWWRNTVQGQKLEDNLWAHRSWLQRLCRMLTLQNS